MADQLTTILHAVRGGQLALAAYVEPGGPNAEATLTSLISLLHDEEVLAAMRLLHPAHESPSLRPSDVRGQYSPRLLCPDDTEAPTSGGSVGVENVYRSFVPPNVK
jgi:hypothetical protein